MTSLNVVGKTLEKNQWTLRSETSNNEIEVEIEEFLLFLFVYLESSNRPSDFSLYPRCARESEQKQQPKLTTMTLSEFWIAFTMNVYHI